MSSEQSDGEIEHGSTEYWRREAEESDSHQWCEDCESSYFAHFDSCPHCERRVATDGGRDQSGDGNDRPVMSPESVEAAAGTARAQVTYQHLEPADPGHPMPDGEFWGAFMRSLASRWVSFKRDHSEASNTFDSDDAHGQTKLVTDGGRDGSTEEIGHRLRFLCTNCEEVLDVKRDGEYFYYGERHSCWGDKATDVAMIYTDGINIVDDRVKLEVR